MGYEEIPSNLICAESAEELSFPGSGRAAHGTILGGTAGAEGRAICLVVFPVRAAGEY